MNDIIEKYNKLDDFGKEKLNHYLDNLLNDLNRVEKKDIINWKKKIQSISVWSDEDIKEMEKNLRILWKWKIPGW